MTRNRWFARPASLAGGLTMFGVSIALLVRSGLGLDPWDVLHQGLAQRTGIALGQVVIVATAVVLLLWIPLRQRPGIGTVANVLLVGLVVDGMARSGSAPCSTPLPSARSSTSSSHCSPFAT